MNLPTTARQPEVTKAEVDRMMKEFAEPAMSAPVTVQTDAAHTILMSPQKSLWKFLRVTAVGGKLVDKPDLDALEELYGQTFDGVTIARANGKKTPSPPRTSTAPCARP
ncbi:Peptidoglycan binding domain-containing protein OS=Streptomyces fumanus OX=67302 GN=GCM10018772_49210 PE=4 SV=1 [Streptomyces fumanus]